MRTTSYQRAETDALDDIRAQLEGRVFHVTSLDTLPHILEAGFILPNNDGALTGPFGYLQNGFFRSRGCVSVFDYRTQPPYNPAEYRDRCSPFMPARPPSRGIAILMLSPDVYPALQPWTLWKETEAWSEMVVPYVEAGHPGPIAVSLIEDVICLTLTEVPNAFTAVLTRGRTLAAEKNRRQTDTD